jgi:hypothetical protein
MPSVRSVAPSNQQQATRGARRSEHPDLKLHARGVVGSILSGEADVEQVKLNAASTGRFTDADLLSGAVGHTNSEVAAQLLNKRTVESHLSSIYRKLDVRSRTELSEP